jgi:hypothetical protein
MIQLGVVESKTIMTVTEHKCRRGLHSASSDALSKRELSVIVIKTPAMSFY